MRDVTEALLHVLRSGRRGALATVVRVSGSTPQQPGARLLLGPDGTTTGTVGGGAVERAVLDALAVCRESGRHELAVFDLGRDLGMCCGGRMEIFVEPVEAVQRLVIFGAGHVARPTAAVARLAGFEVIVVDDREELLLAEHFPGCTLIAAEPAEAAREVAPRDEDWIVVVTHDHRLDEEALDVYARLPHRYLGVIGSQRKILRILQRISQRGPLPVLDRVYAPIGLDIGAVSPAEIAVSIVSELIALRHGKPARHMRVVSDARLERVLSGQLSPDAAALSVESEPEQ